MFRISNLHSRKTKHLGTNLPSMTYRQMSWRGDVWVNVVIFNHWNRCSPWCSPNKCYKTDRSPDDSRCLYNVIYLRLLPQLPRPCVVQIEADMNPLVVSLLLLPFLSSTHCGRFYSLCDRKPKDQSFYNLQTVDLDGSNRTLHHFAGNVTLVVNLATFWGNLKFNTYNEGNLLLDRYHFGKPFVISLYMA